MNLSPSHFSEVICEVDVSELVVWLHASNPGFVEQPTENKPQRVFSLPMPLVIPVIAQILPHFPTIIAQELVLSRVLPGVFHDYHTDRFSTDWLTRVHIPLLTNRECWLKFEEQEEPIHMEVGKAYTFNAERRHAFANEGDSPRVHMIFDAMRR